MEKNGEFARLSREFGGEEKKEEEIEAIDDDVDVDKKSKRPATVFDKEKLRARIDLDKVAGKGRLEGRLIVKEKRTSGSVPWHGMSSTWA